MYWTAACIARLVRTALCTACHSLTLFITSLYHHFCRFSCSLSRVELRSFFIHLYLCSPTSPVISLTHFSYLFLYLSFSLLSASESPDLNSLNRHRFLCVPSFCAVLHSLLMSLFFVFSLINLAVFLFVEKKLKTWKNQSIANSLIPIKSTVPLPSVLCPACRSIHPCRPVSNHHLFGIRARLQDIDLTDPDVAKAAAKIQSTFRGFKRNKPKNVAQ